MAQSEFSLSSNPMLLYFISTLEVRILRFESFGGLTSAQSDVLAGIKKRLEQLKSAAPGALTEDLAWIEGNSLERLMALLEPQVTLLDEVRRRVDQAAVDGVPAEPRLRAALLVAERTCFDMTKTPPEFKATEEPNLRSLLNETLEETHWAQQRKYAARPFQNKANQKIVAVGLISFLFLLAPYGILYASIHRGTHVDLKTWAWLPLFTALTAGLFGACFSRLLFLQQNAGAMSLGGLKHAAETSSIFLRGSVGMCGAVVVFFFLQSGLVSGALFPEAENLGLAKFTVPLERIQKASAPAPKALTAQGGQPVSPRLTRLRTSQAHRRRKLLRPTRTRRARLTTVRYCWSFPARRSVC